MKTIYNFKKEVCTCTDECLGYLTKSCKRIEEPKQETLEEAAENIFKTYSNNTSLSEGNYEYMMDKEDFKQASSEMVKWQQEQDKNLYSEEEVYNILEQAIKDCYSLELEAHYSGDYKNLKQYFEQFKKK